MAGNALVGALRVTLGLDSAAFADGLSRAQKQLGDAGSRLQAIGSRMQGIGVGMSAAITAPLVGLGALAVGEASEMRDALGQVNAALTSMGDTAGRSMDQLKTQADALAGSSLFEDDQILRGVTANLLTFGNIAGQEFDRAQQAAVNLATRLGTDLQSATILVGKALNDPVKGMAALGRAGIQLSDDQKTAIRTMVEMGDAAGAQGILLGELEKQFGGSAQAARDNAPPMERMKLALAGLAGSIGEFLLPVLDRLASWFEGAAGAFGNMSPEMQKFAVIAGGVAAAIGPVLVALGAMVSAAGALAGAFAGGGVLAGLLPFLGPIGLGIAAITAAFVLWGDDIVPMLQAFGKQLADVIGPKVQPLFDAFKGLASSVGEVFGAIFGAGGSLPVDLEVVGQVISRVFGAAVDLITGAINVISNVLKAIGALLRGDFSAMWGYLGSAVMSVVRAIGNAFTTLLPNVSASVRALVAGVTEWLQRRLGDVLKWVIDKVKAVGDAFFKLYDAVVGHSYIPDMVEEIGQWIGKLEGNMVRPIQDATATASEAFGGMADDIGSKMEGLFKSIQSKDWKGALGGIFEMLGGAGGNVGKFANIGSSILKALPGFATGGSFNVGGSGSTDSKLVAFRATPGERVDISTPRQQRQMGGGGFIVSVDKSPFFETHVARVSAPMAQSAAANAAVASRGQVHTDLNLSRTYGRR